MPFDLSHFLRLIIIGIILYLINTCAVEIYIIKQYVKVIISMYHFSRWIFICILICFLICKEPDTLFQHIVQIELKKYCNFLYDK